MNVHAATGAAFIQGTETTTQGVYGLYSDAAVTVPIAAADATNDRISLIVAEVLDATYSGSSNIGQIVEVAGTPASTPVAPATPKNALVLAQVRVPHGATSIVSGNITDKRSFMKTWQNPQPTVHRAEMYLNAGTHNITTADTIIPYDTAAYDPDGACTVGAAATYTCPASGLYMFDGALNVSSNNLTVVRLYRNGVQVRQLFAGTAGSVGWASSWLATAGDTFSVFARASVAATPLGTGQEFQYFAARLLST